MSMVQFPKVIGTLYCMDFDHVERSDIFEEFGALDSLLRAAIEESGLAAIGNPITHYFQPQGLTYLLLLSQSHLAVHTWPEYRFLSIDFFTCGDVVLGERACEILRDAIACRNVTVQTFVRGRVHEEV